MFLRAAILIAACLTSQAGMVFAQDGSENAGGGTEKVISGYDAALKDAAADHQKRLTQLTANFISALEKHRKKVAASGNLDAVLEVDTLLKKVKADPAGLEPPAKDAEDQLSKWTRVYFQQKRELTVERAKATATLTDTCVANLTKIQKSLVKARDLEAAVKVRDTIAEIEKRPSVVSARELVASVAKAPPEPKGGAPKTGDRLPLEGLVAHYTFDKDSRGKVYDAMGKHHGELKDAVPVEEGKREGAYRFGNRGYIKVEHHEDLNPRQITVAAWVNPAKLSTYYSVLMKSTGSWSGGYGISYFSGGLNFFVNSYGRGRAGAPVPLGKWSHVVGTYDGNEIRFYVDGKEKATREYGDEIDHTEGSLTIGKGSGSGYFWNGMLDEVMIFNRALRPHEVAALARR